LHGAGVVLNNGRAVAQQSRAIAASRPHLLGLARFSPMAKFTRLKDALISLGVYRPARYLNDRIRNPKRLEGLRLDRIFYSQFVRPGDLCFDLGANIGRKAEALLGLGARVVSVEPQPHCVRELKALCGHNPRFSCVPKAVGSEAGTATMHISSVDTESSLKPDWGEQWSSSIDVEITTLDQLIRDFGVPRFCKIDVEGFELEVLRGLSRPIRFLSFEYNLRFPDRPRECLDELEKFGIKRLNVSFEEEMRLASDEWWDRASFLRWFGELPAQASGRWYGDIIVECEGAEA
jgi:FkbM family methyltransferase